MLDTGIALLPNTRKERIQKEKERVRARGRGEGEGDTRTYTDTHTFLRSLGIEFHGKRREILGWPPEATRDLGKCRLYAARRAFSSEEGIFLSLSPGFFDVRRVPGRRNNAHGFTRVSRLPRLETRGEPFRGGSMMDRCRGTREIKRNDIMSRVT